MKRLIITGALGIFLLVVSLGNYSLILPGGDSFLTKEVPQESSFSIPSARSCSTVGSIGDGATYFSTKTAGLPFAYHEETFDGSECIPSSSRTSYLALGINLTFVSGIILLAWGLLTRNKPRSSTKA